MFHSGGAKINYVFHHLFQLLVDIKEIISIRKIYEEHEPNGIRYRTLLTFPSFSYLYLMTRQYNFTITAVTDLNI